MMEPLHSEWISARHTHVEAFHTHVEALHIPRSVLGVGVLGSVFVSETLCTYDADEVVSKMPHRPTAVASHH